MACCARFEKRRFFLALPGWLAGGVQRVLWRPCSSQRRKHGMPLHIKGFLSSAAADDSIPGEAAPWLQTYNVDQQPRSCQP